jgi:threonine dehydratase/peptide deformylase
MTIFDPSAAALPILVAGDSRLLERSPEVLRFDDNLIHDSSRLLATLRDFKDRSGYGRAISAIQAGIAKRLIAMNLGAGGFILVNPEIVDHSDDTFQVWDDCLSVPDVIVRVRRHRSVSVRFFDHRGRARVWRNLPEDLSELVQHEVDHLDGVLMTTRAAGDAAIQPIGRWKELVGAARPERRIALGNIGAAATLIDPVFLNTPQYGCEPLSDILGCALTIKVETANPIRCFKGRGASYFVRSLTPGAPRTLVAASAGNFGQALAWAGRDAGYPVVVFAAENANPLKIARMRALGAEVRLAGGDFDGAKAEARTFARERGAHFVEDGREAAITEGAGTIGLELLARDDTFDSVLVPLGNGALLNGVARWIKAASPATAVIGVVAEGAPAMERSFRLPPGAEPVGTEAATTIADGVAVRIPVPEAVEDMRGIVDDVVLVSDDAARRAIDLCRDLAGLVIEPAGGLGIAALLAHRVRFAGQRVATILCGGNIAP